MIKAHILLSMPLDLPSFGETINGLLDATGHAMRGDSMLLWPGRDRFPAEADHR